jgi:nucleoside-diphosphate-sugar epimerase
LRLAGIYGPGRHHLLEQVRLGSVAGRGDHRLNLAHRDDICAAIWSAFAAEPAIANEIFNVADGAPERKEVVAAWLAERLHVAAPVFTGAPAGGRRAVTPDRIISNARLKAALGWRPRFPSYREGYENMLSRGPE